MKFRDNKPPGVSDNVNFLVHTAGLGDTICALVPVLYAVNNIPQIKPLVWVPDNLLEFAKHVLPKGTTVRDYSEANKKYNNELTGVSNQWHHGQTAMKRHPIDHAFHCMLDIHMPVENTNYPKVDVSKINITKFKLPEKYIVIPLGATAKPKELHPLVIEQIVSYAKSKGYTSVFLGKESVDIGVDGKKIVANMARIDYARGMNLLEKTSLLEAAAIMAGAKAVVGMEGGLIHLAGCTDVPIIASYTFVNPDIMMPIRNNQKGYNVYPITPDKSLECRFCQSQWLLMFDHDFRDCYYGPDDYTCVKQITFDKFKVEMDKVL